MLSPCLRYFDQVKETSLALLETSYDSLFRELWEVFVLDYEVVQIVSEVVSTSSTSVSIENPEKADLRPLYVQMGLAFWLEYVEDD